MLSLPGYHYRHCATGPIFDKLNSSKNEKEHGFYRPHPAGYYRGCHWNTVFHQSDHRHTRHRIAGAGHRIPGHQLYQLLSVVLPLRAEHTEKEVRGEVIDNILLRRGAVNAKARPDAAPRPSSPSSWRNLPRRYDHRNAKRQLVF